MLRSELIRPRIKIRDGQVFTRSIEANYHYLAIANDLIKVFQSGGGSSRAQLAEAIRN